MAVEVEDGTCAGWVTWRAVAGSTNLEIGIALFPDHRGHGIGTQAQRQLVSYLFNTTAADRGFSPVSIIEIPQLIGGVGCG